jgi:tetratricopeptide (TPR) repeat protein
VACSRFARSLLLGLIVATGCTILAVGWSRIALADATNTELSNGTNTNEQRHFVAFSLRVAESLVRKALHDGMDFRKNNVLFDLGAMNKPKAIFFDPQANDWILLGERSEGAGDLTLDDFVVALRTRVDDPNVDPGVTIDPIVPGNHNPDQDPKDWATAKNMRVKFFGPLKDTQFGLTCYQADWEMKRVGLGLDQFPSANIPSFFDLSRREGGAGIRATIVSRFWLCPVQNEVPVLLDAKAVFIQSSRIVVDTQTLFAEQNGQIVRGKDQLDALDSDSKRFAQAFTDNYDAAANDQPAYNRLRGLARLAGLAKGIVVGKWSNDFRYYLSEYQVQRVETPDEADALFNEDRTQGLWVGGGVQLRNLALRLQNGDINALTEAVIKMRPNAGTLSWEFLFGDTFFPLPSDATIDIASKSDLVHISSDEFLWLQKAASDGDTDAMLIIAERYLDGNVGLTRDAAESFRWTRKAADLGDAVAECRLANYYASGIGTVQDYSEALTCCERAMQLKPDFAEAYCNKGAVLGNMNRNTEALACYDHAIQIKPDYAKPWSNKSAALRLLGRSEEALTCSGRALELNPEDAEAWGNKAAALGSLKRYPEELQCCERALELDPDLAIGWFNKGSSLFHLGRFDEALTSFDQALKLTPNDSDTWLNRGITLYFMKRYDEARRDITKAAELGNTNAQNAMETLQREGH